MWKLNLLKWLIARLSPRIEPDDAPVDEPEDLPEDDETPEADTLEDDDTPEPEEDEPAPRVSRGQQAIISARTRAQTAERDLATARAELEVARRAPSQAMQPSQDQVLWQQEEDALKNPELQDWQRYSINANRSARQANTNAQNAVRQAEDLSDKSAFNAIAVSKPKLHAAYKDRVETFLKDLRNKGNNVPREKILAILIGEDMLAGKLKSAESKVKSTQRASTLGVRSDVSSSGGRMSDAEKRAKRLDNVRI
jgi:hypothetical protein